MEETFAVLIWHSDASGQPGFVQSLVFQFWSSDRLGTDMGLSIGPFIVLNHLKLNIGSVMKNQQLTRKTIISSVKKI